MPLTPGARLGPYEIVAQLGAGGMGEVYRALDTRLGREVAVKVLPQHLAATPEVRARFDREARTVSQLNFPHICTLYDVGHQGGVDYLVMELLEGETLAQRLARGPLPMPEVLAYGRQVAEALDRAHRAGVVHRDLKPGNIMLTRSGAKLMDFGLARPLGLAGSAGGLTQSPTAAAPLTAEGTIVGTFQYMAPEQLEGKEADARADLWALGCVLYEMATGRRAFAGDSQASLIGSIMRETPVPVAERAPAAPAPLGRLVGALLAKHPDDRVQTAHDVKLQLQWAAESGPGAGAPAAAARAARGGGVLAWSVAAVAVAGALVVAAWSLQRAERGARPVVSAVTLPPGGAIATAAPLPIAISPDGSTLVYVAHVGNGPDRLWVRPLASAEARELPGTDDASFPFFSPDGRTIAFFSPTELRRVSVDGGPVTRITDCTDARGGAWGAHDQILFAPRGYGGLSVVDAGGGTPRPVTTLDTTLHEVTHRYPHFLPDGEHYLYLARRGGAGRGEKPGIYAGRLGRPGRRQVLEVASNVAYGSGHLLYVEQGNLVAQPFDAGARAVRGPARPISNRITMDERFSRAQFTVSRNGVLAFTTGAAQMTSRLEWVDRAGRTLRVLGEPGPYTFGGMPVLDPSGRRAAIAMFSPERGLSDVWIVDAVSGNRQRLSVDNEDHYAYTWGPGARSVIMNTLFGFGSQVIERMLDGSGTQRLLYEWPYYLYPGGTSPDGRWVSVDRGDSSSSSDVIALPLAGGSEPMVIAAARNSQSNAEFSPDGRFVAYESDETGRAEVYVVPFPPTGAKWQVSRQGGRQPAWRADGGELYFVDPENWVTAVAVTSGSGSPEFGPPQRLFQLYGSVGPVQRYAPGRDGRSFLVSLDVIESREAPVTLMTEWPRALEPGAK